MDWLSDEGLLAVVREFANNSAMPIEVFISHTTSDSDLALGLIRLLKAAMPLSPEAIRCTSVPGYKLQTGANVDSQLRDEVLEATTFVALLTEKSLSSTYVLFELGARWGIKKPLFPLMAGGITGGKLGGPLVAINAKSCSSPEDMYQFLADMASALKLQRFEAHTFFSELNAFVGSASLKTPLPEPIEVTPPEHVACPPVAPKGKLNLAARELCQIMRDAIPLQSPNLADEYIGMVVDWETTFSSAYPPKPDGCVSVHLNPWEPEGYDTFISCQTTLARTPDLLKLAKKAKLRLQGKIIGFEGYSIIVEISELTVIPEDAVYGTRLRFLLRDIRWKIGSEIADSIPDKAIEDCIRNQILSGRPHGLNLIDNRKIVPEILPESKKYKLLIGSTAMRLLQSSSENLDQKTRDRVLALDRELRELEND